MLQYLVLITLNFASLVHTVSLSAAKLSLLGPVSLSRIVTPAHVYLRDLESSFCLG